jgi:ATP-dependent Clp endopeptidase proteolytic subunit ClpP
MKKSWYRIEAKEDGPATIFIYDEIGMWGITASDLIRDLAGVSASTITLRVNSPGGDVFDGIAIYNAIRNHPAVVTVQVDGLAASIASIIAMAGDEITIAKNAFFMIHNAWAGAVGGAEEMRKMADVLDKIDTTLVKTYADRTGQTQRAIRQMMAGETWLTAEEAVELGMADRLIDEPGAKAAFDLSKFRNVPQALHSEPEPPTERDIEQLLRDAGVSRKAAKAGVSAIKGQSQRDADEDMEAAGNILTKITASTLLSKMKGK